MNVSRCTLALLICLPLCHFRTFAAFPNAFQVTDNGTADGYVYYTNLAAAQYNSAINTGFRYTINARLVTHFGGSPSLGFAYSHGTNSFAAMFNFTPAGDLQVSIPSNGIPVLTTLTTNASGARAYHNHEILYTPATKLATYSFDGAPIMSWPGDNLSGSATGQVSWGASSLTGQGQMNYQLVRFQAATANAATYLAGSSLTNFPAPPDPLRRGWTNLVTGSGVSTSSVAPDNFWQPIVGVVGENPVIAPWTLPYNDAGAIVTASPVSIEGGRFHSLALKADGTPAGWGDNSSGQLNFPPEASNLIALAAGDAHTIALRADRTVLAWGANNVGQTNIPASVTNVFTIAAGLNHSLALRGDGSVVQWGDTITNVPPSVTNIIAIAAGQTHNIALRSNGTVVTWGFAVGITNLPATANGVVSIAAGTHNLIARTNGVVLCWGDNSFNQTNIPPTATNVMAVAAGLNHCLALRSNGTIIAWGAGTNYTGVAPRFGQAIVPPEATNVIAIAAGDYHSLALRADGVVIAWGAGTNIAASPHFGQAIVPTNLATINLPVTTAGTVNPNVPANYVLSYLATNVFGAVAVTSRTVVVQVTYPTLDTQPAVSTNTIATINGAVNPKGFPTMAWFEWGRGSRFDQTTAPVDVGSGTSPVSINANLTGLSPQLPYRYRLIASNGLGLFARGFAATLASPVVALKGANPLTNLWGFPYVDPGVNATGAVVAVAGGRAHSYALKQDGHVVGWGNNFFGQTNVSVLADNAITVSAGEDHGVVARADGLAVAWGDNSLGQTDVPATATNVVAVSAGQAFNLALRRDGRLVGWGDDFYSQATAPAFVTNIAAISAGERHSLALFTSGSIAAWGYNGFGQTTVPAAATNIVDIAAGAGHSVALRKDGTVFVWGLNSYFQTNPPPTATNVIAISAGVYHSLALRADGTVVAWGAGTNNTGFAPYFGQCIVPASATNVVAIAAGYYHNLAMRADGSVIAWGAGTANTGTFPNLGQAIIPSGLNSLDLTPNIAGIVNTTQAGLYPLSYLAINPFGGIGNSVSRDVYVTAAPGPSLITGVSLLGNGLTQVTFSNAATAPFTVLATTNLDLPTSSWIVLGSAVNISPAVYQFTDSQSTNFPQRFYQVRSP